MNYNSKSLKDLTEYLPTLKCLIVTATDIETKELHNNLKPITGESIIQVYIGNYTYYIGKFGALNIVHVQSGMGSIAANASIMTVSSAIGQWNPSAVIMVGIAFGKNVKKQKIGDVLISDSIIPYNIQKVTPDGIIQRGAVPPAGSVLLDRFKSASKNWELSLAGGLSSDVYFGGMLSGESLVDNQEYRDKLLAAYPTAIGGEMEGAGVFAAASGSRVEWIIVKGICDYADGNKSDNKDEFQSVAIKSSVSLCLHVCSIPTIFDALGICSSEIVPQGNHAAAPNLTKVAFDLYTPEKEAYYLERDADRKFVAYLNSYSIWLSGESGCGKTTLIFRNLYQQKKQFKFINLVHCVGFDVFEIFVEFYNQFKELIDPEGAPVLLDKIHKVLEGICALVSKAGEKEELIIFLEEIPLPETAEVLKDFIAQLIALLILNRSKNPDCSLKIVLSSIDSPIEHVKSAQGKIHEILKFFPESNWGDEDAKALILIILKGLGVSFSESQLQSLVTSAKGSPRFIKNFIRDFVISAPDTDEQFQQLLVSVSQDLNSK